MDDKFFQDSFEVLREKSEATELTYPHETIVAVLSHKQVRKTAKNWKVFSSDAPGRVPIPEETGIRDVRQLPIELDPPLHTDYRALVEPIFKQPLQTEFQQKLQCIIDEMIGFLLSKREVEVVREFSLPLQSKALTLLLNLPIEESNLWIDWGTHVFRSTDGGELDKGKASNLDTYIRDKIEKARCAKLDNIQESSDDFFSVLMNSTINGKSLSDKEVEGIANLTFAGGRDTVINLVTNTIWVFAEFPTIFERLKKEQDLTNNAIEELVRFFSPLSQIGRVAKEDTQICEHAVNAEQRVSLCWVSANRDSSVFVNANELMIDRKQNPHVGFGFGAHTCLGSTHARQLMKQLIPTLIERVETFEVVDMKESIEDMAGIKRKVGFEHLNVKITAKSKACKVEI